MATIIAIRSALQKGYKALWVGSGHKALNVRDRFCHKAIKTYLIDSTVVVVWRSWSTLVTSKALLNDSLVDSGSSRNASRWL